MLLMLIRVILVLVLLVLLVLLWCCWWFKFKLRGEEEREEEGFIWAKLEAWADTRKGWPRS